MLKSLVTSALLIASSLVASGATNAAHASCAPTGDGTTVYATHNITKVYVPTNLASSWVYPNYGSGHITYDRSATEQVSASVTATAGADAGLFVHASASIGVTVGKSWSYSNSWSYGMDMPQTGTKYLYRMHLYQFGYTFLENRVNWNFNTCSYQEAAGFPTTVKNAPVQNGLANVWQLDRQAA